MRVCGTLLAGMFLLPVVQGQPAKLTLRYGYEANEDAYSQKTPAEALQSVVKALKGDHFGYLMAQLADPAFVDKKIADYQKQFQGEARARTVLAFERLVKETAAHFQGDPLLLQELQRFAKEAEWKMEEQAAVASLKVNTTDSVHMRKLGERWFLENRR